MHHEFIKPDLSRRVYIKDTRTAIANIAALTAKDKGGNRLQQDNAALLAVIYYNEGNNETTAIYKAVNDVFLTNH